LVPKPWMFGPSNQLGSEFHNTGSLQAVERFIKLDIPISWALDYTHFFPTPGERGQEPQLRENNDRMNYHGLKQTTYYNSYVKFGTDYWTYLRDNNMLIKKIDSDEPDLFLYLGSEYYNCSQLDYTNPAAVAWYRTIMQKGVDIGFNGMMWDFGEYMPYYGRTFNGSLGDEFHNMYPGTYQKVAYDFFTEKEPSAIYAPDYVHYARSGWTGAQRYTWVTWSGDPSCDWTLAAGLPAQILGMVNVGLGGVPVIGSDIGGFFWGVSPPPDDDLWCRWSQFGVFSGIMRTQTGGWGTGPKSRMLESEYGRRCWRKCAKMRTQLFPYIYNAAHEAHFIGTPLMRHHLLEFHKDPVALQQDYDYLFGSDILVAPVINPKETAKKTYLPKGVTWYDMNLIYDQDGRFRVRLSEPLVGGTWHESSVVEFIPMYARAGSIIPAIDPSTFTLSTAQNPEVVPLDRTKHVLHLWVYPDENGKASVSTWDKGVFTLENNRFVVQDARHLIVQIMVKSFPTRVISETSGVLPTVPTFKDLISIDPATKSSWTIDREAGTLWVRLSPADRAIAFNF
jgi:alpha-glucosidase